MRRVFALLALAALVASCSEKPTAPAASPHDAAQPAAAPELSAVHAYPPGELTEFGRFFWEYYAYEPCAGVNLHTSGWTVMWARNGVTTPSGNTNISLVLTFEDVSATNLDTGEPYPLDVRVVQPATMHAFKDGASRFEVVDNEFWSAGDGHSWRWHITYMLHVAADGTIKAERSTGRETCGDQ